MVNAHSQMTMALALLNGTEEQKVWAIEARGIRQKKLTADVF